MAKIDKKEIQKILMETKWSYSRVSSYKICPKMFYIQYILKERGESGSFAEYGTYLHSIMELYNTRELAEYELLDYYREHYKENVTKSFPPNPWVDLEVSYYGAGETFLSNFDGYKDKTIGAEEKFDFDIKHKGKSLKFTGVVDRISEDDNGIIISDYKSKKAFKSKKEMKEYFRQLYVYCIPVWKKYGKLPYKLKFSFFRDYNKVCETLFDEKAFEEAKDWIFNTVDEIFHTDEFTENYNEFFCQHVCSVPCSSCQYRQQE